MILQTAALCSLLWFVTCEKQSIFLNEWAVKVTGKVGNIFIVRIMLTFSLNLS